MFDFNPDVIKNNQNTLKYGKLFACQSWSWLPNAALTVPELTKMQVIAETGSLSCHLKRELGMYLYWQCLR